jgi:hypothetical protein
MSCRQADAVNTITAKDAKDAKKRFEERVAAPCRLGDLCA